MCYHVDKRRLVTGDGKTALIHKSSVNIINKDPKFPSPYFVFGEKVCVCVCVCMEDWYAYMHVCMHELQCVC